MPHEHLTPEDARSLAEAVLTAHRTSTRNARQVAEALVAAELSGHRGHGLARLPSYAAQASSGKVDGHATPTLEEVAPALVRVDAANGFAYPALAVAREAVATRALAQGVAMAVVHHSHHAGVAGQQIADLAKRGLVALLFANTPRAIAPWGGSRPVYGTNPIAFAAPREDAAPLVVDLSLSVVARGRIMLAAQEGRAIEPGWALDRHGRPTTSAEAAMAGSMLPIGDAKGAALALMVEVLAAGLGGARFGFEASSFFDAEGAPPGVGQLVMAIDPGPASGGTYLERIEDLVADVLAAGASRLPGSSRAAAAASAVEHGLAIPAALHADLQELATR